MRTSVGFRCRAPYLGDRPTRRLLLPLDQGPPEIGDRVGGPGRDRVPTWGGLPPPGWAGADVRSLPSVLCDQRRSRALAAQRCRRLLAGRHVAAGDDGERVGIRLVCSVLAGERLPFAGLVTLAAGSGGLGAGGAGILGLWTRRWCPCATSRTVIRTRRCSTWPPPWPGAARRGVSRAATVRRWRPRRLLRLARGGGWASWPGPVRLSVVWAMYGETGRMVPRAAHPHGEDFVRAKVRQLDWLTGGLPGVTWSIIGCDDGCRTGPPVPTS